MASKKINNLKITASILYLSYFMMGLRLSMVAQYKPEFATIWHTDVSGVLQVVAAIWLGGIISILITGPVSDYFGRKFCAVIGHLIWASYFIGLLYAPNLTVAYIIATTSGIGQSFVNSSNFPSLMEIFPKNASIAGIMTKFAINIGQFALPIFAFVVSLLGANYRIVFWGTGLVYLALAFLLICLPFPQHHSKKQLVKQSFAFTDRLPISVIALALIGYTSTAVFLLWVNTYQELAKSYGVSNPIYLQTIYAFGASIAVVFNSFIIKKGIKEVDLLLYYPLFTALSLILTVLIKASWIVSFANLAVGFFAAGGLYQLALTVLGNSYPTIKATAQSWAAFFSALSNLTIFSIASWITGFSGANSAKYIVIMNIFLSLLGSVLALIVKVCNKKG